MDRQVVFNAYFMRQLVPKYVKMITLQASHTGILSLAHFCFNAWITFPWKQEILLFHYFASQEVICS